MIDLVTERGIVSDHVRVSRTTVHGVNGTIINRYMTIISRHTTIINRHMTVQMTGLTMTLSSTMTNGHLVVTTVRSHFQLLVQFTY